MVGPRKRRNTQPYIVAQNAESHEFAAFMRAEWPKEGWRYCSGHRTALGAIRKRNDLNNKAAIGRKS